MRVQSASGQVTLLMTNSLIGHVLSSQGHGVVGSQGHVLISHMMYKWRRGHVMSHVQGHVICSHGHVVLKLQVCS